MDRRQRKVEKKAKKRRLAKQRAREAGGRKPKQNALIIKAAQSPFGPCAVSRDWDHGGDEPELVSVVVTHRLPDDRLLPAIALVDRTCLGIKNGFVATPLTDGTLDDFLDRVGSAHGGMATCEPLVAQSVVFHAIDYARRLGFEPHREFPEALFGPRPAELIATPWHAAPRPNYFSGPDDDVRSILARLDLAVGRGNYDFVTVGFGPELWDPAEDEESEQPETDGEAQQGADEDGTVLRMNTRYNLLGEIASLISRCARGESVVIGLSEFVLFSSATGDAWLLEAFSDGALNLMRDFESADLPIQEDDHQVRIEWGGTYAFRGPDFITDALPGEVRLIRGYPTEAIRSTIEQLLEGKPLRREPPLARRNT